MCRFGSSARATLWDPLSRCRRTSIRVPFHMLRAGLIGFPSSGKTALFQLMTRAREAARSGGKAEASVGVSRVPDERLDRLTALFNPRKRVPATVEFADIAGAGGAQTGAQALLDVAPFRNADALLHVVRMFRDPAVPHPAGAVDPARDVRTMEDEVILADLWRRRAPSRTSGTRFQEGEQSGPSARTGRARRHAARHSRPVGRCGRSPCRPTMPEGCAAFNFCRPSRCCWC